MRDVNWLSLTYLILVLILIAPAALARTCGRLLPMAALWLAAIVALAWAYQTFGPS
jgi:hypothetical protein